eukprot:TRINITY_DN24310_c0_g1_i1.p1 TRINITY_DN24310_c0_g1~~TRINITY_DN24310_c0_g1_i1.p1  ORF type:complete len:357 (+),score=124.60 TRINITY_DN24310_c0_g1_i1:59-1129(+)
MDEWELLCDELCDLQHLAPEISPPSLVLALRAENPRAALAAVEPLRGGVHVRLVVPTPLWSAAAAVSSRDCRTDSAALNCEVRFSLPPRYPRVGPLEQDGGAVEVKLTGHLTKQAQAYITRTVHSLLFDLRGSPDPRFMTACVEWLQGTELHEFAAAAVPRKLSDRSPRRMWLRLHHIESELKRLYARLWAEQLKVGGLVCVGQPALVMVEGPAAAVGVWHECFTTVLHWGPTPCHTLLDQPLQADDPVGSCLVELRQLYPRCVSVGGAYNGRDAVDFDRLERALAETGRVSAAQQLRRLLPCVEHDGAGRVREAADGSGWVGYTTDLVVPAADELPAPQRKPGPKAKGKQKKRVQ